MVGLPIGIKASKTILNPWYILSHRVIVVSTKSPGPFTDSLEITPNCRVELPQYGIRLFFRRDQVGFVFVGESSKSDYLVNPIRDFLAYKTFVSYNALGFWGCFDEEQLDEVETIRFKVERIVRVESERHEGEETVRSFHHEGREEWLELPVKDLVQYLNVLNPALYYATAFYLIGCENSRYFLVEFYKAVEAIKNTFGSETSFLQRLEPYGITKRKYKDFSATCNDARVAPLDIGRHAPQPSAPLYSIDLRYLLVDPRSSEVFESATVLCRQVIDAYTDFLVEGGS